MNKNKISYRPRTADPSTLTTDNLLTLANIITTSGLDHHCPPSLGVLTSVQITMLYLQENIRQQTLAGIFGTSQPTISRAINTVLNILDVVLPPPPRPKDLNPQRLYVLDGTLVPCWWWKNARNLYSGKHHRAGHNLQILTDQAGQIFYISEPLPGGLFSCWENTTAPPSVRQQTLAGIFATSQATISRAAGSILSVLDVMLPPPERYFPSN